jgi:hypothetical protein
MGRAEQLLASAYLDNPRLVIRVCVENGRLIPQDGRWPG